MNNLAIIIQSCDAFEFLWEGWLYAWQKYWDFKIPYPIYFITETKSPVFPKVINNIQVGKGEFSSNLIHAFEKIPESHIFYMQDDFWLRATYYKALFDYHYNIFYEFEMDCLRIIGPIKKYKALKLYFDLDYPFLRFQLDSPYIGTHISAFWKKVHFLSILKHEESPWTAEGLGTERLRQLPQEPKHFFQHLWFYNSVHSNGKRHGKLPWEKGVINVHGQEILRELGNSNS
jgi:hypothetical protein